MMPALRKLLIASAVLVMLPLQACVEEQPLASSAANTFLRIDKVRPWFGRPGTKVYIFGEDFGDGKDSNEIRVVVGQLPAQVVSVSPNLVTAIIPDGASESSISVTRSTGGTTITRSIDFRLINSPFAFVQFGLELSGVKTARTEEYHTSTGFERSVHDTSDVSVSHFRLYSIERQNGCDEINSGTTVHICLHNEQTTGFPLSAQNRYEYTDDFTRFTARIDTTRHLLTEVRIDYNRSSTRQEPPLWSRAEQYGRTLVLRDLPYSVTANGNLFVELHGSAIANHIIEYRTAGASSEKNGSQWANENYSENSIIELAPGATLTLGLQSVAEW